MSLAFGAPGPIPLSAQTAPRSQLPATQPGLSRSEGVFLITAADDGSRLVYFIAQNTRHSTLPGDLQLEQQLNSLWPVRLASREEVLAFAEGAPVGSARTGLLDAAAPVAAEVPAPAEAPATAEAPAVAAEAPVVAEAPVAAAAPAPTVDVLAITPPTLVDSPPALSEATVYVLKPGDNLTRISDRYATTIPAILAANGLSNANRIYIGQALIIPAVAAAPEAAPAAANPAPAPAIVESPAAPMPVAADEPAPVADAPASAEEVTYTVKPGDSAIRIARQFGVDVDELLAVNGVANRNRVYVGEVLNIPGA